jgi:hypothetical protein
MRNGIYKVQMANSSKTRLAQILSFMQTLINLSCIFAKKVPHNLILQVNHKHSLMKAHKNLKIFYLLPSLCDTFILYPLCRNVTLRQNPSLAYLYYIILKQPLKFDENIFICIFALILPF